MSLHSKDSNAKIKIQSPDGIFGENLTRCNDATDYL